MYSSVQLTSKGFTIGSAKLKGVVDRDQKLKMAKTKDDNQNNELDHSKLQSLLKAQTKEAGVIKDDLKNHNIREFYFVQRQRLQNSICCTFEVAVDQLIVTSKYPGVAKGLYVASPSGFSLQCILTIMLLNKVEAVGR
nr:pseudouridine synthase family protein [Tanacetum cinerariifolium]